MYITGEDFYFLTYNLLLILSEFRCFENKVFKDHRKLPLLLSFITQPKLIKILKTYDSVGHIGKVDINILSQTYSNSLIIEKNMNRLLFSLEKKGLINLTHDESNRLNVSLKENDYSFLQQKDFDIEKENAKFLRAHVQRTTILSYETFVENLIIKKGVYLWGF